jgi:hypothetical protein
MPFVIRVKILCVTSMSHRPTKYAIVYDPGLGNVIHHCLFFRHSQGGWNPDILLLGCFSVYGFVYRVARASQGGTTVNVYLKKGWPKRWDKYSCFCSNKIFVNNTGWILTFFRLFAINRTGEHT